LKAQNSQFVNEKKKVNIISMTSTRRNGTQSWIFWQYSYTSNNFF